MRQSKKLSSVALTLFGCIDYVVLIETLESKTLPSYCDTSFNFFSLVVRRHIVSCVCKCAIYSCRCLCKDEF